MPSLLRLVSSEIGALARVVGNLPRRIAMPSMHVDSRSPSRTPVVFVHGLFGDPSNFVPLQRAAADRGIRNWGTFSYLPRLDFARLAPQLVETIRNLCNASGADRVDVIGHSLGGLIGRYVAQSEHGGLIRRLVTLGAPYLPQAGPHQELSIFASHDALIATPERDPEIWPRMRVIEDCGHIGLLSHAQVLREVPAYLTRPELVRSRQAAAA
ncbi:MAG TPA: alpha/beta fold hydrolase [Candidatus Binatia bacterium]|nr:alpha/beta fold hydrolase [Candidatus Binatia bacterium]